MKSTYALYSYVCLNFQNYATDFEEDFFDKQSDLTYKTEIHAGETTASASSYIRFQVLYCVRDEFPQLYNFFDTITMCFEYKKNGLQNYLMNEIPLISGFESTVNKNVKLLWFLKNVYNFKNHESQNFFS